MNALTILNEYEVRRSDWIEIENLLAWKGKKIKSYRVWYANVNGFRFRRHEWFHENEVITVEPWIETDLKIPAHLEPIEYSLEDFMKDAKKVVNKGTQNED